MRKDTLAVFVVAGILLLVTQGQCTSSNPNCQKLKPKRDEFGICITSNCDQVGCGPDQDCCKNGCGGYLCVDKVGGGSNGGDNSQDNGAGCPPIGQVSTCSISTCNQPGGTPCEPGKKCCESSCGGYTCLNPGGGNGGGSGNGGNGGAGGQGNNP